MTGVIKIDMMASDINPEMSDQSVMEADQVISDVNAMTEGTENGMPPPECCIYRVPNTMRDPNNKDAYYTPKVVSIGPFHYDKKELSGMERHKRIFFKRLVGKSEIGLEGLVRFVTHLEPKVRASYFDKIELDKKKFVQLILVDAAFIIQLFKIVYSIRSKEKAHEHEINRDRTLLQQWWLEAAAKDLVLLGNQLPFFVIEGLFHEAFPSARSGKNRNSKIPSFRELTFSFFESYKKISPETEFDEGIKHFTDLLRSFFLSGTKISNNSGKPVFIEGPRDLLLYSATELQEAGVKLKASTKPGKSLLDLNFSSPPSFEIPEIFLEDRTEILFRNMIALEQCHYQFQSYITEYAFVMDCLINEHQDVCVLTHKKVIHNFLGDADDVANLFNGLSKNIMGEYIISSGYHKICKQLNEYCERPWNKRKANLRRDYCKTAWHTMASAAAIVVILLTLIQTILSVLQIVLMK